MMAVKGNLFSSLIFILLRMFPSNAQLITSSGYAPQVKISAQPFPVSNTQHLNQIVLTMIGKTTREPVYCVSEHPVSQLRFLCVDCVQKNIIGINSYLSSAQDLTHTAQFPTIVLPNVEANSSWSGATIICQASINGGTVDSQFSTITIRYLKQPKVLDANGQGPVFANLGYHFYVECIRGADGLCQQTPRRKTLRCSVEANPPATTFHWLKNGGPISGNGPEISIGTDMIGQSIQCSANNGLFGDDNMPTSQAVIIDPYTAARLLQDNFQQLQNAPPFQSGNRVEMNQRIGLICTVEGNPRPVVFWKLRHANGQIADAPCPQGLNGQYREVNIPLNVPVQALAQQPNIIRLNAICDLQITNYSYSGQYWCSACSYVSTGYPECSPGLDSPGDRVLNLQVQGAPMAAEIEPFIEQPESQNAVVILVPYCGDPAPKPPRELLFSIDGNDIQIGQNWQNIYFESFTQNNTVPNCYFVRLRISPISDDDQGRKVVLKLQNQYGMKQITVPMTDLLGGGSSDDKGIPSWLSIFILIGSIALALILFTFVCRRLNLLCFDRVKDDNTNYSSDKLKPSVHDGYSDDSHRGLYGNGGPNGTPNEVIHHAEPYMTREAVV